MKKLISLFVFFGLLGVTANAAQIRELPKPTGVKVGAVFNFWENIYTPQLCYPNAAAYQVSGLSDDPSNWERVIFKLLRKQGSDNKDADLMELETESQIRAASSELMTALDVMNEKELGDKLVQVLTKKKEHFLFLAHADNGTDELTGSAIVIVDLENFEIVLLMHGETFKPRACD